MAAINKETLMAWAIGIGTFVTTFLLSWLGFWALDYPNAMNTALALGSFTGLYALVDQL